LEQLPIVTKSFEAGDLCYSKVRAVTAAWSPEVAEAMTRDEQLLVDRCGELTVRDVVQMMRYWKICAGDDHEPADQWTARRAYLSATLDGVHHLEAVLDPEGGAEVAAVLDDIDHELWQADQGAARAAGGVADRSPAQRRADALVEMARRAATVAEGGRRPRPLAHVVVGYDTYAHGAGAATLNGSQPISAAVARRLCCDANLARVVTDPAGVVIDLGEARNPSASLRIARWSPRLDAVASADARTSSKQGTARAGSPAARSARPEQRFTTLFPTTNAASPASTTSSASATTTTGSSTSTASPVTTPQTPPPSSSPAPTAVTWASPTSPSPPPVTDSLVSGRPVHRP
jgi:hypothetical protein